MKRVYLNCIYRNNFGDDLLIKKLCDRYKNCEFFLLNYENGSKVSSCPNLRIFTFNNFFYRLIRKFSKTVLNKRSLIEDYYIKKCDVVVTIGGSIFMEEKGWNLKNDYNRVFYKNLKKPYFIIGSNIGPIYTDEYLDFLRDYVFKNANDVCLRDNKSYSYVKNMPNVRVTTDLLFSLNYNFDNSQKKVFISVINPEAKRNQLKNYNYKNYEKYLLDIIDYFKSSNYEIIISSFCKLEGDEVFIKNFVETYNIDNIEIINYNGDVSRILEAMSSSDIIIGTRFHANIIGMILNKFVLPISYNDKTINMLNDIDFEGYYCNLEENNTFDPNLINFEYKCDVNRFKKKSEDSFKILDDFLIK